MRISRIVEKALEAKTPVVALETTVLTHGFTEGLSFPIYMETVEAVTREGAVPAPIGILGGRLTVGLAREELERLSQRGAKKAGLSDLAPLCAKGENAGTTVAATLFAARKAGISLFATGGIGGAHRGSSSDVSGDLHALSRLGGCVVCSGAKSICDLRRTVVVLDTLGVPVVGYGTEEFPAFFCAASGIALRHRVNTPEEAADVLRARDRLGLSQAILLVQPPPVETALPRALVEEVVEKAVAEAEQKGVSGSALTPYLLTRIAHLTEGSSVKCNRALLSANAALAARVAACLGDD